MATSSNSSFGYDPSKNPVMGDAGAMGTGNFSSLSSPTSTSSTSGGSDTSSIDNPLTQADISLAQWDQYKHLYAPLENMFASEAAAAGSDTAYTNAAQQASSTVNQQFDAARGRILRGMPGVDLNSPAVKAGSLGLDLAQAASSATQQNMARQDVTNRALQLQTSALGLGKNLAATAAYGLSSADATRLAVARSQQQQNMLQAQGLGNIIGTGANAAMKWWNSSSTPTTPTDYQYNQAADVISGDPGIDFADMTF